MVRSLATAIISGPLASKEYCETKNYLADFQGLCPLLRAQTGEIMLTRYSGEL